jgi:hypothetical protein
MSLYYWMDRAPTPETGTDICTVTDLSTGYIYGSS